MMLEEFVRKYTEQKEFLKVGQSFLAACDITNIYWELQSFW